MAIMCDAKRSRSAILCLRGSHSTYHKPQFASVIDFAIAANSKVTVSIKYLIR